MANDAILREVTLTLPMAPEMEITASKTAAAVADFMGMSADKIDEVRMAVIEGCINAFEHSGAADGKVHLTFAVYGGEEPRMLQITIRDEGSGFSPESVPEPNISEKITAEDKRGWGLRLMRSMMDDVEIRSGSDGTSIVLSKAR